MHRALWGLTPKAPSTQGRKHLLPLDFILSPLPLPCLTPLLCQMSLKLVLPTFCHPGTFFDCWREARSQEMMHELWGRSCRSVQLRSWHVAANSSLIFQAKSILTLFRFAACNHFGLGIRHGFWQEGWLSLEERMAVGMQAGPKFSSQVCSPLLARP